MIVLVARDDSLRYEFDSTDQVREIRMLSRTDCIKSEEASPRTLPSWIGDSTPQPTRVIERA